MNSQIRPFAHDDIEAVIALSLRAWAPVFHSFAQVLGPRIYAALYPDWQRQQREVVARVCTDADGFTTCVAQVGEAVVGFIAYAVNSEDQTGEVELLAVHPDFQNRGIGTALNTFVLEQMRERGVRLAVVGTGGDPGHAPARRSYEKAGYTALPLVRYYQAL
jgi:ribosomal protein S18 acetylase RimI-like enzyme